MNPNIGWPLRYNKIRRGLVNHTFGMVRRNADGTRRPHQGWDFAAANGTPCFAVADGEIVGVWNNGAYGQQVILRFRYDFDDDGDADDLFVCYAHLSRVDVHEGQLVRKGQQLGLTGSSGNAKGMTPADQHLHFEVRTARQPGRGLQERFSPLAIFGRLPLKEAVIAKELPER
jgi:murein DD-endopeptidase MepM/ murein hydrolase activator NlpD